MNSRKIINDPVFGFINIPDGFIYEIICHPYLQRLSRIKQLGFASLVYPGAQHSRFHHSLGAMYLMNEAITQLRSKGHDITDEEAEAALACILLHDVGHGPFSHVLEDTLVKGVSHEQISLMLMNRINAELKGKLDTTIAIFKNEYPKKFLHQLVSGQLDMDRLDYLRRDSFFTGVTEGNIGSARIIKMLNVKDDRLVVEAKGIYSTENFLMARRLMYWQVYLHKTTVTAEKMLINTFNRAAFLAKQGVELQVSPALLYFINSEIDNSIFINNPEALDNFIDLDDNDVWCALKIGSYHQDKVLSTLSRGLVNRQLFKIEVKSEPFEESILNEKIQYYVKHLGITAQEANFLISSDEISTNMYNEADDSIDILFKNGETKDIAEASDMLNIELLSKRVKKYYFCYLR
ncbi:MAG: HD domain-containing protein [Candidatus Azobacteroides sp.]|nr:HD domain-containing protein [Candidatus Azobacteroides sp.]